MKTRSIKFKFLVTVISAMIAIAVFIGAISIYELDRFAQKQTESFVRANCENEALKLNGTFQEMEKSVQIMENYISSLVGDVSDIQNLDKRAEILTKVEDMFAAASLDSVGAIAYYFRLNPTISDSKAGLFYSKVDGGDEYIRFEPTDISMYDKNDTEHVGWFWQPYEAGKPIWMEPYYNQNNDVAMISYVMPIYLKNTFIGVVGMDFNFEYMINTVHQIKIYENGHAHIEMNGQPVHHDNGDEPDSSDRYFSVSEDLINGMTITLSASHEDLRQIRYEIAAKLLIVVLVLVAIFTVVVILWVKRMVVPLGKLAEASKALADGDYDVEIVRSNTYELNLLSVAFENMIVKLRETKKSQHLLAYRDSLTGLRNTTSYKAWTDDFDKEINSQNMCFGVVVFDINNLKETNDKYGHNVGNTLIVSVSRIIADTFKRSPVFRIGGDEFLVILQNRDFEERERLFEKVEMRFEETIIVTENESFSTSVAMGYSEYDSDKDVQFADVFNRADDEMYHNKRKSKGLSALDT